MKHYFVYILSNKGRTVLYTGVTNGLTKRVIQHRKGENDSFTRRYHVTHLVYFESFGDINAAIAREKQIKRWRRAKKENLIKQLNAGWDDLAVTVLGLKRLH